MRDSDWSRQNLLRCDWLLPQVALMTTFVLHRYNGFFGCYADILEDGR